MSPGKPVRVMAFRVGHAPVVLVVPNTLDTFQALVQGYVEDIRLSGGLSLWCNEDGLRLHLPPNPAASELAHRGIVGDTVVVRNDGRGELCDLTDADLMLLWSRPRQQVPA
jgi:Domain of unknown function (DUF3846)